MSFDGQLPPKARLLRAAAELLAKSAGAPVSTRQITQLAGVTAPTLYHHFGDKEGLFDAVVTAGFEEYVKGERDFAPSGKPLEDIRRMWDNHVEFGLNQPELYLVMFGNIRPERRPSIVADAEALMEEMLNKVAVAGHLNVPPREAARSILAANVGVTLMLIAEPVADRNLELSTMTRDAMIFAVSTDEAKEAAPDDSGKSSVVVAAIALNAALQASHSDQLSSSELKLFLEWLHRISNSSPSLRVAPGVDALAPEATVEGSKILDPKSVILTGTATTRDAAIYEAGRLLLDRGAVDSGYITAMHEREESVSTYMGSYLAIPHGTNAAKDHIKKSAVSVVRYPRGIDWNGKEVRFVVGVAGISNEHLHILSSIAEVFAEKAHVAQLEAATSAEEVLELFAKVNSGDA